MIKAKYTMSDIIQIISTIVLIITLVVLIMTYLNGQRPFIGIISSDATYDKSTKELSFKITIKNTGNVVARGVKTDSKTYENEKEINERKGELTFVLFPNQETYGVLKFHGVTEQLLHKNTYSANYLIYYEQPVTLGFIRRFRTLQRMQYEPSIGNLKVVSGNVE